MRTPIISGAMMLEHLGHPGAAAAVVSAIERLMADTDLRTADLGGNATTREIGETSSNSGCATATGVAPPVRSLFRSLMPVGVALG